LNELPIRPLKADFASPARGFRTVTVRERQRSVRDSQIVVETPQNRVLSASIAENSHKNDRSAIPFTEDARFLVETRGSFLP
jgi:hypothetical protein